MPWSSAPARRVCTTRCPWRQFTGRRVAAVARGYGLRDKLARTSTRIARMVRVWPSVKLKRHGFECGRRRAPTLPRTRPHVGHSSDTVGPLSGPADNGEHEPPDDISAAPDISLHCRCVAGCPAATRCQGNREIRSSIRSSPHSLVRNGVDALDQECCADESFDPRRPPLVLSRNRAEATAYCDARCADTNKLCGVLSWTSLAGVRSWLAIGSGVVAPSHPSRGGETTRRRLRVPRSTTARRCGGSHAGGLLWP
jgi:hypothetical protein